MKNEERLIFLTNDDGYSSRGMQALIALARRFGRVVVVAPEEPQSGMSQAFTLLGRPLYLRKVSEEPGVEVYAFGGTPVDCVKMAFDHLLAGQRIDLVVSGINHGSNSAVNVLYSGTMGAAIEGSFYDCPSVGLSVDDHSPDADFEGALLYGEHILRRVLEPDVELPLCLNVNIPAIPPESIRGIRVCRQAAGYWRERFDSRRDDEGREYFTLTGIFVNTEPDADDTDEWAVRHGYVAVVPVQVDLTDRRRMAELRMRLEK